MDITDTAFWNSLLHTEDLNSILTLFAPKEAQDCQREPSYAHQTSSCTSDEHELQEETTATDDNIQNENSVPTAAAHEKPDYGKYQPLKTELLPQPLKTDPKGHKADRGPEVTVSAPSMTGSKAQSGPQQLPGDKKAKDFTSLQNVYLLQSRRGVDRSTDKKTAGRQEQLASRATGDGQQPQQPVPPTIPEQEILVFQATGDGQSCPYELPSIPYELPRIRAYNEEFSSPQNSSGLQPYEDDGNASVKNDLEQQPLASLPTDVVQICPHQPSTLSDALKPENYPSPQTVRSCPQQPSTVPNGKKPEKFPSPKTVRSCPQQPSTVSDGKKTENSPSRHTVQSCLHQPSTVSDDKKTENSLSRHTVQSCLHQPSTVSDDKKTENSPSRHTVQSCPHQPSIVPDGKKTENSPSRYTVQSCPHQPSIVPDGKKTENSHSRYTVQSYPHQPSTIPDGKMTENSHSSQTIQSCPGQPYTVPDGTQPDLPSPQTVQLSQADENDGNSDAEEEPEEEPLVFETEDAADDTELLSIGDLLSQSMSEPHETNSDADTKTYCGQPLFVSDVVGGEARLTIEDIYIEAMTLAAEIRIHRRQLDNNGTAELNRIMDFCRDALREKLVASSLAKRARERKQKASATTAQLS